VGFERQCCLILAYRDLQNSLEFGFHNFLFAYVCLWRNITYRHTNNPPVIGHCAGTILYITLDNVIELSSRYNSLVNETVTMCTTTPISPHSPHHSNTSDCRWAVCTKQDIYPMKDSQDIEGLLINEVISH
jgi:hypothetical protein